MINKNKKRLLSAFVSVMMMSSVVNGMESYQLINISKFKEEGNAYIREFPGDALNKLHEKYEPINNDKIFAGHAGVVSQYRCIEQGENYGKIVAVKCIPDPEKTRMETAHVQDGSNKKEIEFFEKIEKYENHPGIVNCYGIFSDDNVTYIVQDWIEGITFEKFCEKCNEANLTPYERNKFILKLIKKICEIYKFTTDKMKIEHIDPNPTNIMLVPKSPRSNNIKKEFEDFDVYLLDWGEYDVITADNDTDKEKYQTYFVWKHQKQLVALSTQVIDRLSSQQTLSFWDSFIENHFGEWGRNFTIYFGQNWGAWKPKDFKKHIEGEKRLFKSYGGIIAYCEKALKFLNR